MTNWLKRNSLKKMVRKKLGCTAKTSYLTLQKVFPSLLLRDTSTPGTAPLSKPRIPLKDIQPDPID